MTQLEASTVCIHLITEGPTDRKLLSALIPEMIEDNFLQFVEISSTQRVRTGKQAIVTAPPIEIGGIQGISAQRLQPQSHTIDRRVLVAVHRQPTMRAGMDSIREGLFDDHTTSGTSL